MGKNRYVGHRYIPIFENGWDKTRTYEPLTFVYYEGKTYVSRQLVPTNIEITDNDFWAFFMDNTPQIFTPTFIGEWVDTEYEPLSIVVNNGNTYVSKQNVPVGTLLTDTTYWLDLSTYYNQLFTDYENAEQERQQAELIRIDNEEQRKIDHENRSAELAGKADKVVLKNSVKNGDFSQGKDNWRTSGFQSSFEIIDGVAVNTEVNTTKSFITGDYIQFSSGNKIYISFVLKVSDFTSISKIRVIGGVSSNPPLATVTNPTNNDFNNYSTVLDWGTHTQIRINPTQIAEKPNVVVSLKSLLAIDLTATFGKGNEPTKEEMDELIKVTGYIDGEYALNNKEMLMWTLSLIRGNKNAIISLGGTI